MYPGGFQHSRSRDHLNYVRYLAISSNANPYVGGITCQRPWWITGNRSRQATGIDHAKAHLL